MPAAALNNNDAGALSTPMLSACATGDAGERPARSHGASDDGGRALPVIFSVGLHLAILLALLLNLRLFDAAGLTPALSLPLEVELVDGRSLLPDDKDVEEPTATATTAVANQPPQASARPRAMSAAPQTFSSQPTRTPTGEETANDEEFRSDTSVPGEAPQPKDVTALPTSEAESPLEVPVRSDDPAEPEHKEMPVSLRHMVTRRIMRGLRNMEHEPEPPSELSWKFQGQEYTAFIDRQPAQSDTDIERVNVEVQSQRQGRRVEMHMQMKRLAFSHFTQLIDEWDDSVALHDDELEGRFHSNTPIFIVYDREATPQFLGKVTTAAEGYHLGKTVGWRRRSEMFHAGFESDVAEIRLPAQFLRLSANHAQMQTFPDDTRITFYPDGTYGWTRFPSNVDDGRRAITGSTYLVGSRRASLYVRGTVKGKVTIYSPQRIVIEDDLKYADDSVGNDCLGLVSDRFIEVAPAEVTGPGNLEIHAAIYARKRLIVSDLDARNQGTLLIRGSLTAGSLSATEPRYATRVEFDPRLERQRPPGFPVTDRFEVEDSVPLSAVIQ